MEQNGRGEQTIADYLAVVRRYKWVILVTAIVVPIVAYLLAVQQPKVFRATSDVLLNRQDLGSVVTGIPTTNTFTDPDRYARTQAALARVPEVARVAVQRARVKGMAPWQLLASSSVEPRGNTDLLTFSVRNGDRAIAASLATAYAQAFAAYKLEMDTTSLSRARKEIQNRLDELRRARVNDSGTYRQLVQKSQDLRTLELLQVPASVVRKATGASQIAPTPNRNATLGVLLGLLLGLGGAFVLNALDRRVRDAEEIERELQVPLLAKLPAPRGRGKRLTILDGPPGQATEAVSRLRTAFDFANAESQAKVVMATSAGPREGKSTTVANLAIALSRTGRHVVLVDLDFRRPALARLFHLSDLPGVTDVAAGKAELASILSPIVHLPLGKRLMALRDAEASAGVLEVLTAGQTRVDPGEFVETAGLSELLHELRSRAEVVLIDAPPILAAGDAMALTGKVDAILLISRLGTLTSQNLRELARVLGRSPAPVLGFVATGADRGDGYSTYRPQELAYETESRPRAVRGQKVQLDVPESASAGAGRWTPRQSG